MSEDRIPPKVENAPGLVMRARKVGWIAFWLARTDLVERGFKPVSVPLWRGEVPAEADVAYIQQTCAAMQASMLVWGNETAPVPTVAYDGTIAGLARCYENDADSPFHKLRYAVRQNVSGLLRRIAREHGNENVKDLNARAMLRWHEAWAAGDRIPMAHTLIGQTRTLFSFGMTLLECPHCTRMSAVMSKQRYAMGKARDQRLTAQMAVDIRIRARVVKTPSLALAQAFQFECALRQKDIIGEWVPDSELGLSDVVHNGQKWLRGLRWSEIDEHLILRHVTSKRQKLHVVDLKLAPMVLEELRDMYGLDLARGLDRSLLPASGPVIVDEELGRPYMAHTFRYEWRKLARAVGIPDNVRNMDTRAGAITEGTDSGADLESVRHMATHSNISMTAKYSRGSEEKTAEVMKLRTAHRNKSGT